MGQAKSKQVKVNYRLRRMSLRTFGDAMSLDVYDMLQKRDLSGLKNLLDGFIFDLSKEHLDIPFIHWILLMSLTYPPNEYVELLNIFAGCHMSILDPINRGFYMEVKLLDFCSEVIIHEEQYKYKYLHVPGMSIDNLYCHIKRNVCDAKNTPYIVNIAFSPKAYKGYLLSVKRNIDMFRNVSNAIRIANSHPEPTPLHNSSAPPAPSAPSTPFTSPTPSAPPLPISMDDLKESMAKTNCVSSSDISLDDTNCCVVCMDGKKEIFIDPCGHISVCRECINNIEQDTNKCPICRGSITTYKQAFFV